MILTGDPGAGKSAVAAQLVRISAGEVNPPSAAISLIDSVSAYHFCHDRDDVTLNPLRFVQSLSKQLTSRYPQLAATVATESDAQATINIEAHQQVDMAEAGSDVRAVVINRIDMSSFTTARDAFDKLVRQPLQRLYDNQQLQQTLLIVVDSLDEALTFDRDSENTIIGVLGHREPLPPNVFFLFTSRRTGAIDPDRWGSQIDLILDAPHDSHDVEGFCLLRLGNPEGGGLEQLAKRIGQASEGNFLYAKFVLDDLLREGGIPDTIDEIVLPVGLEGVYQRFLERDLLTDLGKWQDIFRKLLGLLAVARGRGLARTHLLEHFRESVLDDALAACLPYIRGNPPSGPFQPYHLSFREFLLSNSEYPVYPGEAHLALGRRLYENNRTRWRDCGDEYALRYTVKHLVEAVRANSDNADQAYLATALGAIAADFDYLQAKIERAGVDDLVTDLEDIIDTLPTDSPARPYVMALDQTIQREQHHLRRAGDLELALPDRPSVLHQLRYRATALGLDELAHRANQAEKPTPSGRFGLIAWSGAEDPALVRVLAGHSDVVMGVGASADGSLAFSGDASGLIKLWDVGTGRSLWSLKLTPEDEMEFLSSATMSRDGPVGLTAYHDGRIAIWDLGGGKLNCVLHDPASRVSALSINAKGTRALAGFEDHLIICWDLETRGRLFTMQGDAAITAACLNGAGDAAIIGDRNGTVAAIDVAEGREIYRQRLHSQQVQSVAFSEDDRLVITCGQDGAILILSSTTRLILTQLPREGNEWLYRARLTSDGILVITSAEDNKVRLWDVDNRTLIYQFTGHSGAVTGLDLCGPSQAVTCGGDHNIIVWDLERATELSKRRSIDIARRSRGHENWVRSVSIAANASIAASGAFDSKIVLWNPETGHHIDTIEHLPGGVRSISLSADGEHLLALCHERFDNVAVVWNVGQRRAISQQRDLGLTGWAGAISADGQQAIGAIGDGKLCRWDIPTGLVHSTFEGHEAGVYCATFGPGDATLLSGASDSRAILWETRTAAVLHDFRGHTGAVMAVALSHDGRLAATGAYDCTARVWDTETGLVVNLLEGHGAPVMAVGFSGDGRYVISGSEDKTLILWDVVAGTAIDRLFLDSKVSCIAAVRNRLLVGDYGGALYFFGINSG
jgi:WD40 repeat protein